MSDEVTPSELFLGSADALTKRAKLPLLWTNQHTKANGIFHALIQRTRLAAGALGTERQKPLIVGKFSQRSRSQGRTK